MKNFLLIMFLSTFLTACSDLFLNEFLNEFLSSTDTTGQLSSNGGSSSTGTTDQSTQVATKTGKFLNVSGLNYTTSSGLNGILQDDSLFQYQEGDAIKFYKDDIVFGEIQAEKSITVYSFDNEITVIQVLTAMDSDQNSNNGYQIR